MDLLNEEELLTKTRHEYTARRLPCEGIEITCSNIIDSQIYMSDMVKVDMVKVDQIIESKRDCFWINVNQLYTPQCYGTCGHNITFYEHMLSIAIEMRLGINPDDEEDFYELYQNDTFVDEFVCDEYFGDINRTMQTLSNVDAIVDAALRLYKERDVIHDISKNAFSQITNGSINCDGFRLETDDILINSAFSVQSV
eukprot:399772_1